MIKAETMGAIKALQYKRYQTSVEMLEIRKTIEKEQHAPEWPEIWNELHIRGVRGYFIRYTPQTITPIKQK
jgi:L-rhamnose mutarotase